MAIWFSTLQQGFIYGIMALGIYISFKILNVPDLTMEGSFSFGLAVSAMMTIAGHPYLGLVLSLVAGAAAGCVTGILQTKLKIHPILAGIITMSGLYSINLKVMDNAANVSLLKGKPRTIISDMRELLPNLDKEVVKIIIPAVFVVLFIILLTCFFKTHYGLCIRATGDNADMLRASSVNVDVTKIVGLGISNACIAFSGGLLAQIQGYADINSSIGMLVVGLASVIIGETIFGRHNVMIGLISVIVGSVIYRLIISVVLRYDILPVYMFKLVSAVVVAVALSIPAIKENINKARLIHKGRSNSNVRNN